MPTRLCLEPSCPNKAVYRGRCRTHTRERDQLTHARKHFYNSKRWQLLRRKVLFEQPLCACGCEGISTDVDHIQAIEAGGNPWDRANLQALTAQCHSRKTRQEQTRWASSNSSSSSSSSS